MNSLLLYALGGGVLAVVYGLYVTGNILRLPVGSPDMNKISDAIAEGAQAFLKREYTTIAAVSVAIVVLLGFTLSWPAALGFAIGAFCSALAGAIGMSVAVRANIRTSEAAKKGLNHALAVAFSGGSVTGLMVAGLALLSLVATYYFTIANQVGPLNLTPLVALGFGASLISVFARLGGGIYTKGADVGTDMVGKI